MSFGFRVFASILVPLSLAVALPAVAGDVDTRFDRARGKPAVKQSPAEGATTVHLDAARGASEVVVAKGQTVTVVVTPHREQTCSFDVRVK
jgi:hypothetical protein